MATLGMFSFLAAARYRHGLAKKLVLAARNSGACMQTHPSLESMAQAVPAEAYLYWKRAMAKSYPKHQFDNSDWLDACLGLRQFLMTTLGDEPSWHVASCPPDAYTWAPRALADAWALAHVMERIDVRAEANAAVPLVFAMDKAMRMPGGLAFYRDAFEPLGGHYCFIDNAANISQEKQAADILSESFLYDDPQADTPEQALKATHAKRSFGSRALSALHAVLGRSSRRAAKINPTKPKTSVKATTDNGYASSYSRDDDPVISGIASAIIAMSLMSDSSASSGGASWSSSAGSCNSGSSSSGSSCSSSGSSCGGGGS